MVVEKDLSVTQSFLPPESGAKYRPVLKVDAHGAHVRRTKESLEDQKAWRPKNLAAQRAERTKVLRRQTTGGTKKYALMSLVVFVEI